MGNALYVVAVAAVVVRMQILDTTWRLILLLGAIAIALVGFAIIYVNCRCPHCGRGLGARWTKVTMCPYCEKEINERAHYHK